MNWKPIRIPTYDSESDTWSERTFEGFREYLTFVQGHWSEPGKYNLKNTHLWRGPAIKWLKDRRYTDFSRTSKEYKAFWEFEKHKVLRGVIVDGFFVMSDYYWYLNFTPIYDKVKGTTAFAEVWDGDYHSYLYDELSWLKSMDSAKVKARQKGYTFKHVSKLLKPFWFEAKSVSKILGYDQEFVDGAWGFLEGYKEHLNEHTAWYRNLDPSAKLNWMQRRQVTEGTTDKKKVYRGKKSRLLGKTVKMNPAKAVGGSARYLYIEEGGICPNADKVIQYGRPNIGMGSVKTGQIIISGAVGELKDAKPLEKIAFNPEAEGFMGVPDIFSEVPTDRLICFFCPDYWNYIHEDAETKEITRCYDEDGNSDIELAKHYLKIEEERHKKMSPESYRLWKSQHPWSLHDAFGMREENPFPTVIINEQKQYLIANYKSLTVELIEEQDNNGHSRFTHKFNTGQPIATLKPDPLNDNSGCVEIDEFPEENTPWGLYYAGIDPIKAVNTSTSRSLMSVVIYKAVHFKNGQLCPDYPVARYTGRCPKWEDTYEICRKLIRYYNARTAVESNIGDFIEWMIRKGESQYLMRRREIVMINEMVPQSTIRDEIGVRVEGVIKEKMIDFAITYVDEITGTTFDAEGVAEYLYGVKRIKDRMLLEEMMFYNPDLNTDRLIAFILAVMAARSNTNRNIIVETKQQDRRTKPVQLHMPSQFTKTIHGSKGLKMPSPFKKR
jgi:hypothetical protein